MKTLTIYAVLQGKVISEFTSIPDPNVHVFDRFFVEATAVLAGYGDGLQEVMSCLCARALLSWSTEDRQAFVSTVDTPARVYQQLTDPSPWPEFGATPD